MKPDKIESAQECGPVYLPHALGSQARNEARGQAQQVCLLEKQKAVRNFDRMECLRKHFADWFPSAIS
jgi:hypothetical protein